MTVIRRIIGADEVGVGPIAGPVVVCAVCVPENWKPPPGLRDSKRLNERQREDLEEALRYKGSMPNLQVQFRLSVHCNLEIDERGLRSCIKSGFNSTVGYLKKFVRPDLLADCVIDGGDRVCDLARCEPKADDTIPAVMAASILAKTYCDLLMRLYDLEIPGYQFAKNKGYPTADHLALLKQLGPSRLHRKSFGPVAEWIREDERRRQIRASRY